MIHTILRVSMFFDGDLVTVGKVSAKNAEEVSRMIGLGPLTRTELKLGGKLTDCFELQVEVDGCDNGPRVRSTVLVMENIPHHVRSSDLPEITGHDTLRSAYKESLRI